MSETFPALDKFLSKARDVLQSLELDLQNLAQEAWSTHQESRARGDNATRWYELGRQFDDLAARSKIVRQHLNRQDAVALPLDDENWPRVRILQSQQEERMQVARALEESIGQLLANTVFELASYRNLLQSSSAPTGNGAALLDDLKHLQTELEQGLSNFRYLITQLDPTTVFSNFGLAEGVRRYLEQYQAQTGITARLQVNTNFGRLPTTIETAIFRIIQEALNNVSRHANAGQVEVVFDEKDAALQFSIIDDGQGVASEKIGGSRKNLGLARMIDYAELLNGTLRVLSEPQHGTTVILSIPYPAL